MLKNIIIVLTLLVSVAVNSCGTSKKDYTTPFQKTFELVYGNDTAILYLQRTIQEATEYDSLAYSIYSGKIAPSELGGYIGSASGMIEKGGTQVRLTFEMGKKDTMGFLNLSINGNATKLEGWKGQQVSINGSVQYLPDSVRVNGREKSDKNTMLSFGLKPKAVPKEHFDERWSDPGTGSSEQVQMDTIMELVIKRERMDSAAFQRMMDDVKASDESGSLSLHFVSDKVLSLERFLWEEGGAHSLYYTYYYSYDLNTGKRLKLLDVFQPYTLSAVADAINKNLKQQLGLKPGQSLKAAYYNDDYIGVSKNFFVTDKGIGFQYNIYEIASFASGATTVFVPFQELQEYLNPKFLDLTGKSLAPPAERLPGNRSAKFEGKWIPVRFKDASVKDKYMVIKKDGEKFRLYAYENGRLVENNPEGFLYYNEKEDGLSRTDNGVTITIRYNRAKKSLTLKIPASSYDREIEEELVRMD